MAIVPKDLDSRVRKAVASSWQDICQAFAARDFQRLDVLAFRVYKLKSLPDCDFVDPRE